MTKTQICNKASRTDHQFNLAVKVVYMYRQSKDVTEVRSVVCYVQTALAHVHVYLTKQTWIFYSYVAEGSH